MNVSRKKNTCSTCGQLAVGWETNILKTIVTASLSPTSDKLKKTTKDNLTNTCQGQIGYEPICNLRRVRHSLTYLLSICWFHGSSFKGFSIVFPAPWLAKVKSSQKSNGMWFFRHFFAPHLFHRSRNNRRDKLRSKFWREKCSENHIWSCWDEARSEEPTSMQ